MRHREILKKSGLIVLITLILTSAGLVSYCHQVAADDLGFFETDLPTAPEEEYVPDQIIVKFKEGVFSAAEKQLNESLGTSVIRTSPGWGFKLLKIPAGKTVAEMVDIYSKQAIVEYAEPNYIGQYIFSPNDTIYSVQWNFGHINMEAAWDLDTTAPLYGGDPSIVVAVLDSGVAYEDFDEDGDTTLDYLQAPDLANTNFWVNSGEIAGNSIDDDSNLYVDDINGWDFFNNDAHPNDDLYHGTHVTGTIAQSTNNSLGVAGIAFNTTIMPLKIGSPSGPTSQATVDAIKYAADKGAHVINLSISISPSTTLETALAYARDAGVVIVASAGNNYLTGNDPAYPAAYNAYCIAVGATDYLQSRSYYSNTGSYLDVAAPGGDTTKNYSGVGNDGIAQNTINPSTQDPTDISDYWLLQGTSMASPHVAGVAALILAKNPTWTPAQVKHALESTATDKGTTGRDDIYGWGLIDALAAVNSSLPAFESYKQGYPPSGTQEDIFDDYATENKVYMYATTLLPSHQYRVAYYDGRVSNDNVVTETKTSDGLGNLSSEHTFVEGTDTAGTWNVIVCEVAQDPPATYDSNWEYILTSDTFTVQASAIPEFPTVVAAIVALALCAGIYLWMRRKTVPVPA